MADKTVVLFSSLLPLLFLTLIASDNGKKETISPSLSLVFGSGINPKQHPLPIQYVYLQLRTGSNEK